MYLKTVIQSARPPFLILTPICVFLGIATSLTEQSQLDYLMYALLLIGAMSAHISVNVLNEYHDFKSGLDLKTDRTPFSGGSGALPENPAAASSVLTAGLITLALTSIIGLYFLLDRGFYLLPVGITGLLLIITYTQWINRMPWLCLISPGMGFGVLMIIGTHMVLSQEYVQLPWLITLVPFFLVNNLLLLNQYPDMAADASVGRKTFPIVFGINNSNIVYGFSLLAAYSVILLLITTEEIPTLGFIALLPMGLALFSLSGAIRHSSAIGGHPQYLGANVAAAILTPLLLGISIVHG